MKVGLASTRHQEVSSLDRSDSVGARFRHQKAPPSTYITYLVIQRAFSETEEHNYFPDPPNGAARVIVLGAWCLLPRHDNDPDGNPQTLPRFYSARVPINRGAVARRR